MDSEFIQFILSSVETHALEQSLQFIKSVCAEEEDHKKSETLSNIRLWPVGSSNQRDGAKKQKIAAVIGAASSQVMMHQWIRELTSCL